MSNEFYFIGHRGTRIDYDENTVEAFQKAMQNGANIIEFDVRKTRDQRLVLLHDAKLQRTTSCTGKIEELSYDQIKNCKTIKRNAKIPLLREVLEHFIPKVKLMIELKGKNVKDRIIQEIQRFDNFQNCILSGRNLGMLFSAQQELPGSKCCYNITKGEDLTISQFFKRGKAEQFKKTPEMMSLRSSLIDDQFINICHKNNIKALSWDFINYNRQEAIHRIKELIELGIDGILFDNYKNIPLIKNWIIHNF